MSHAELKALVAGLLAAVAALRRTVGEQRDEIARLKGLKGRPAIKPSGMEKASEAKPPAAKGGKRSGGSKAAKLVIDEERVVAVAVPAGSRCKGHATPRRKAALRARFDRICKRRTGFATLDRLLQRLHANKPELLIVLDRPESPLHTNGSENDIRCHVTKRKVSGGTAMPAATAATPSSVSPRPAPSSASPSGITSAPGSPCPTSPPFHTCPTWSASAAPRPDRPAFRPCYAASA